MKRRWGDTYNNQVWVLVFLMEEILVHCPGAALLSKEVLLGWVFLMNVDNAFMYIHFDHNNSTFYFDES